MCVKNGRVVCCAYELELESCLGGGGGGGGGSGGEEGAGDREMILGRSNTWPVVVKLVSGDAQPRSQLECAHCAAVAAAAEAAAAARERQQHAPESETPLLGISSDTHPGLALDPRKTATLNRHYYPEGGWGYVVVASAVLIKFSCSSLYAHFSVSEENDPLASPSNESPVDFSAYRSLAFAVRSRACFLAKGRGQ
ncbi:unnamed protein product [Bemisia tabaci]|uniref:Uncharacterized protein n=1 Tax=Bemisia tabaci TaxID=7038 RepID=A0A9P0F5T0_BEMTA|nr:unnamed protein product [Bemisia tabaci]